MKNIQCKGFKILGLLAVLLLSAAAANATYTPSFLPESTLWQGSRFYDKPAENVYAYVEYAVYDTWLGTHNSIIDGFAGKGDGQYIYAYEIYNFGTDSMLPITMFKLVGGDPAQASGIGNLRDGSGSDIVPTNNGTSFVWNFENGVFVANEHSAFMVFSSDRGPVAGSFKISTLAEGGEEPPVNGNGDTPEPATLALLAGGALSLIAKRNRK